MSLYIPPQFCKNLIYFSVFLHSTPAITFFPLRRSFTVLLVKRYKGRFFKRPNENFAKNTEGSTSGGVGRDEGGGLFSVKFTTVATASENYLWEGFQIQWCYPAMAILCAISRIFNLS